MGFASDWPCVSVFRICQIVLLMAGVNVGACLVDQSSGPAERKFVQATKTRSLAGVMTYFLTAAAFADPGFEPESTATSSPSKR